MSAADATMPTFTAHGGMSVKTASSSAARNSGVASSMAMTPIVFCAVSAVTALMPYTPFARNVLRSAWTPAPPLESLPAIVRTGISNVGVIRSASQMIRKKGLLHINNPARFATPRLFVLLLRQCRSSHLQM